MKLRILQNSQLAKTIRIIKGKANETKCSGNQLAKTIKTIKERKK